MLAIVILIGVLLVGAMVTDLATKGKFFHGLSRAYAEFRCAFSQPKVKLIKVGGDFYNELKSKFPKAEVHTLDGEWWTVDDNDWAEILHHVLVTMPTYRSSTFDCENFAEATSAAISREFGVNAKAWCWGKCPGGGHGWFVMRHQDGTIHQIEPQTGEVDPDGYEPWVIIQT